MIFLFRGLTDELIESQIIATLCILCDVIKFINSLQTFSSSTSPTSFFALFQEFIDIARKSSGGRYQLRSYANLELTHFWPMFPFYTLWKYQKTKGLSTNFIAMAGRCWNQMKMRPNRSSFMEQKKELLFFVYSFYLYSSC